jgi:hypothetical protein
MRFGPLLLPLLLVALGSPAWASEQKPKVNVADTVCDAPPCSKAELQRAEKRLIKRLQRANQLAVEADYRGEKDHAVRLHHVFMRNFDRRKAVTAAIASAPD